MAEKTFEELVASNVLKMQARAAAGKNKEYQQAAFDCAVQTGELKRKVAVYFLEQDVQAAIEKRKAAYAAVQAAIAQDPSLLPALDPAEHQRQLRAAEKAAAAAEQAAGSLKATVEAAPCESVPTLPDSPTSKGNGKGKSKGKTSAATA